MKERKITGLCFIAYDENSENMLTVYSLKNNEYEVNIRNNVSKITNCIFLTRDNVRKMRDSLNELLETNWG